MNVFFLTVVKRPPPSAPKFCFLVFAIKSLALSVRDSSEELSCCLPLNDPSLE